jgi:hypothetical protein
MHVVSLYFHPVLPTFRIDDCHIHDTIVGMCCSNTYIHRCSAVIKHTHVLTFTGCQSQSSIHTCSHSQQSSIYTCPYSQVFSRNQTSGNAHLTQLLIFMSDGGDGGSAQDRQTHMQVCYWDNTPVHSQQITSVAVSRESDNEESKNAV